MILIKLFKVVVNVGSPPLCSCVIAVPSGPKSPAFTVILAVFAHRQDGVINREKVRSKRFAPLLNRTKDFVESVLEPLQHSSPDSFKKFLYPFVNA